MGWLLIFIILWISLDVLGMMFFVLNEIVMLFRCIVIKDMEKLKKNEIDFKVLN